MNLKDARALVTGGSEGIGYAIAGGPGRQGRPGGDHGPQRQEAAGGRGVARRARPARRRRRRGGRRARHGGGHRRAGRAGHPRQQRRLRALPLAGGHDCRQVRGRLPHERDRRHADGPRGGAPLHRPGARAHRQHRLDLGAGRRQVLDGLLGLQVRPARHERVLAGGAAALQHPRHPGQPERGADGLLRQARAQPGAERRRSSARRRSPTPSSAPSRSTTAASFRSSPSSQPTPGRRRAAAGPCGAPASG